VCVIDRLGQHAVGHLDRFFPALDSDDRRYHDLHVYTREVMLSRTRQVKLFQFILGCSIVINGLMVYRYFYNPTINKKDGS